MDADGVVYVNDTAGVDDDENQRHFDARGVVEIALPRAQREPVMLVLKK